MSDKLIRVIYTVTKTYITTLNEDDIVNLDNIVDCECIEDEVNAEIGDGVLISTAESSHIIWEYLE